MWLLRFVYRLAFMVSMSLSAHGLITANLEIEPAEVYVGDSVTLTCTITVGPGSSMINLVEWTKHTVNAEDEEEETVIAVNNMVQEPYWGTNRYTVTVATEGEIGNDSTEREVILTLTVNDVSTEDSGLIGCEIPRDDLSIYQQLSILTNRPIMIHMEIEPAQVYVGGSVMLTCTITVRPGSSMINMVEWTKRTVNAEDEEEETVIAVNNMVQEPYWETNRYTVTVATEGEIGNDSTEREVILTLTVNDVSIQDSGLIGCEIPREDLSTYQQLSVMSR